MSSDVADFTRIFMKEGLADRIANPSRMQRDRIIDGAFYGDGRLRPDIVGSNLGGDWNGVHPQIGPAHIWFDRVNRALRAKDGAPTSETDGFLVVDL